VVIATAQAIEVFLQLKMREHDDRLWRRYEHRLDPGAVQRALVTASGRLIVGSPEHWGADTRLEVPDGGGEIVLPSGDLAVAEPVGDEAYVVTRVEPTRRRAPGAPPVLQLWLLGPGPPHAALDGAPVALRPRLAELLAVLAAHPHGASADVLCAELYGDAGHPGSVRVEMSRLRKLLGAGLDTDRYRLAGELHSDVERVRGLLAANAVREAAEAYPGPLLPDSEAPRVVAERDELEGWLRTAVLGSDDAEALWAWVQGPSGADDLLAWSRLLGALAFTDARRSRAAARTRALREEL
jgi:hypothetical protein